MACDYWVPAFAGTTALALGIMSIGKKEAS
jgi:hypothetical protein